jgi:RNA polymerase sigma-70 factor (ECF subfamily)
MFPTTRWTLILGSRDDAEARRGALEQLFAAYWKPIYFYARRKGLSVEDAQDAVQGLLAKLLESDFLGRLDPARGRFRGYLKAAMDHHLVNLHERDAAQKRGGHLRLVPLDVVLAERDIAGAAEAPDQAFEREWAVGVMERSLARLRAEYDAGRRRGDVETVLSFFRVEAAPSYAEAAARSRMSVAQFKASLHRARARFREILREETADTLQDPAEAELEVETLVRALGA